MHKTKGLELITMRHYTPEAIAVYPNPRNIVGAKADLSYKWWLNNNCPNKTPT
ncbi:MAG: hypothetical protein IPN94_12015 [Sphingobacteriales bacterium]|nr:hypothetical protein [Sphingobacteriales bacterium]